MLGDGLHYPKFALLEQTFMPDLDTRLGARKGIFIKIVRKV